MYKRQLCTRPSIIGRLTDIVGHCSTSSFPSVLHSNTLARSPTAHATERDFQRWSTMSGPFPSSQTAPSSTASDRSAPREVGAIETRAAKRPATAVLVVVDALDGHVTLPPWSAGVATRPGRLSPCWATLLAARTPDRPNGSAREHHRRRSNPTVASRFRHVSLVAPERDPTPPTRPCQDLRHMGHRRNADLVGIISRPQRTQVCRYGFLTDVKGFLLRVGVSGSASERPWSTPYCADPLVCWGMRARCRISGGIR